MLSGRAPERARVQGLLEDARSGRSGALVIRGAIGSGKTTLLADAVERAEGFTVLRTVGVHEESQISFSGLDELLSPIVELVDTIAEPQREALRAAFDLDPSPGVSRGAASRAVLSVLAAAADSGPVLCVVDDAHLVDPASASALAFAARRIKAEGIAMLFAVNDEPTAAFAGLDELRLGGLGPDAARELLERQAGVRVEPEVASRLAERTGGNPQALAEAAAALSDDELTGRAPLRYPPPVGAAAGLADLRPTAALSPAARDALVTAAAADTQTLRAIAKEGAVPGITVAALEECEAAELIAFEEGRVTFREPLLRAAVYQAAPPPKQRAAHRLLAAASSGERRALHLAAAATGPDEEVAAELELAAESARRRSSHIVASNWFVRAANFSPERPDRARRLFHAADAAWRAGQAARAEELAGEAGEGVGDPLLHADIELLRARIELDDGREAAAHRRLVTEAERIEKLDAQRAARLLTTAVAASPSEQRPTLARRAFELAPRDGGETELQATLALARALVPAGDRTQTIELLERARSLIESNDDLARDPDALLAVVDAFVEAEAGHVEFVRDLLGRAVATARERGALGALPRALLHLAHLDAAAGRWDDAYATASEAAELAGAAGQHRRGTEALAILARLDALRGRVDESRLHLDRIGTGAARPIEATTRGLLAAAEGDSEKAMAHFERGEPELTPDLVEAYVRAGRTDDAKRIAASHEQEAQGTNRGWMRVRAAWARALVADDDEYAQAFADARAELETLAPARPFELARLRLNWGERLRRSGHRNDAREHLRAAHETFEPLAAEPWAERARAELRASGETARRRNPSTLDELTPQELQVLREIAAGATYREAAQNLFLSPKTIEFHLGKIYRKLGVTSRRQLEALYGAAAPHEAG